MFFQSQSEKQKKEYYNLLKIVGSLSNLFSDSKMPYLYYRVAEKIFQRAFKAEDLSRSDVSVDAKKESLGIGLKTFLSGNHKTFQKVAEFNNSRPLYKDLEAKQLVLKIAELRNERIDFTERTYGLSNSIYHCVLRDVGRFLIFEEPMSKINIPKIKVLKKKKSSIVFNDGKNEYSFLLSKSTLAKRFVTKPIIYEFDVKIFKNPFNELEKLFANKEALFEEERIIKQTIFLPLYGKNQTVFERSGLNQWNAGGRKRHQSEAYIPVPAEIHRNFPKFFPSKNIPFNLNLPDGTVMKSKVCQDGRKALMSDPNKALGKWILRDILKLEEGKLLTYERLQIFGIDSVRIDKISDLEFEINFASIGSYEEFKDNFN